MIKPLALIAIVALSGCATASKTYLDNGRQGLTIDCSGQALTWATCYEKAAASCPGGKYSTMATSGTAAGKPEDSTLASQAGQFQSRTMVISCK